MAKPPKSRKPRPLAARFSIAEWYGVPLTLLSAEQRRGFAEIQVLPKKERPLIPCPFQDGMACKKNGGVCTLRLYEQSIESGIVQPVTDLPKGALRTMCPLRFEEDQTIYKWVGETVLGCSNPSVLGEIGFLETPRSDDVDTPSSDVGKIDKVLVVPGSNPLSWCALEVQAVYFQGKAMSNDFYEILKQTEDSLHFSPVVRRPDYRSSGPKRLMPQLQIKVPSLRRWGTKMAVVVDYSFFKAMGEMRTVPDISNSDVAWFVVKYEETESGRFRLVPDKVHLTTLEASVEGLTAGVPVSRDTFEQRIRSKLQGLASPIDVPPNQ